MRLVSADIFDRVRNNEGLMRGASGSGVRRAGAGIWARSGSHRRRRSRPSLVRGHYVQ